MLPRAPLAELPAAHAGASPGMLRRRYSVPETIMRKYRLAQQRSDTEESALVATHSAHSVASASPARGSCHSLCDSPHRFARRDRELMRKSALLRRMWGRGYGGCDAECTRAPRSLDTSHAELRPMSASFSCARASPPAALSPSLSPTSSPAGWATPKRQRLDGDFRTSDEMLRAAVRNCSDRAEEARLDRSPKEYSDLVTYRSHCHEMCNETATDPFTDSDAFKLEDVSDRIASTQYSEQMSSDVTTAEMKSSEAESSTRRSRTDSSEPQAGSGSARRSYESGSAGLQPPCACAHIDGRVSERDVSVDNDETNMLPYDRPLTIDTPVYDVLEIVVSEAFNVHSMPPMNSDEKSSCRIFRPPTTSHMMKKKNINIDDYVSNILVESLNSLTDQLEYMNASIESDRKISIVEKEIKVKLQNTGVNTIVHLSPRSNNQIIFGNEELCINEDARDECNNPRDTLSIREEALSGESNNNTLLHHDAVNKAVLHQIQQLFRGEYPPDAPRPCISHVEMSNVDVFIDEHSDDPPPDGGAEFISGVGTGNYYQPTDDTIVPRFSAFPHTESMEVNTSSSEEVEALGSDCTSLVDSLDDPNSPRSALSRRTRHPRRAELVRSAIDVLDLLPESECKHDQADTPPKDKGEAFFIRIKEDSCDCQKENINVAEHMPEKIRQKLYRRQRKRELRMEYAKRSKAKQMKRELDKQRLKEACRARREVERDCIAIASALIDDVIMKIAQEEYKCMRIRQRPARRTANKSDDSAIKKNWRKDMEHFPEKDLYKVSKRDTMQFSSHDGGRYTESSEKHQIHGKLSLLTRPTLLRDERGSRRVYQKSEIHEGNKCIEILEILEYVNGSHSSSETANSDENLNPNSKTRKSKIPVPIHERTTRSSRNGIQKLRPAQQGEGERRAADEPTSRELAQMLLQALGDERAGSGARAGGELRRASVPPAEPAMPPTQPRARSNSLRFKQVFDIIPEERSSISVDSSAEDNRRGSAAHSVDEPSSAAPPAPPPVVRDTRSAGTSPLSAAGGRRRSQTTMTSPCSKSAATSPAAGGGGHAWGDARPRSRLRPEGEKLEERKLATSEYERVPPGVPDPAGRPPRARSQPRAPAAHRRRGEPLLPHCHSSSSSSDTSDSGGSLLCSLAPRWLGATARPRRRRRVVEPAVAAQPASDQPGGWSVTVAGSCRAALPADVEMRLRFPHEGEPRGPPPAAASNDTTKYQECWCERCACAGCACGGRGSLPLPPRGAAPLPSAADSKLTLTMKKEALDSSILASKSRKKTSEPLPDLETYRASRSKVKSSVKMRRGCSLHCWLPDDEPAPLRPSNGLSVLGSAIIPELKPRVPTMSERDLTRVYTPRHYLRS